MDDSGTQQAHARFWRKFLRLTRGRVPVLRALEVMAKEERDAEFAGVISAVHKAMEQGGELSGAIQAYPQHFSPSVIELVKTAEKTGAWDEILVEIADGLEEGTFQ